MPRGRPGDPDCCTGIDKRIYYNSSANGLARKVGVVELSPGPAILRWRGPAMTWRTWAGALAIVAHTAYHLGAVRQVRCALT